MGYIAHTQKSVEIDGTEFTILAGHDIEALNEQDVGAALWSLTILDEEGKVILWNSLARVVQDRIDGLLKGDIQKDAIDVWRQRAQ